MSANTPAMIINLPPHPRPEDVATPSDVPGTPNSGTTTMSELSTVAIKDGHRGHLPHGHQAQPLDAERADRISRLAGLDRVAQPRGNLTPSGTHQHTSNPPQGYFDASGQPQIIRERSTVGSASATGSVGGRTTWASGSDVYDPDKMSEDQSEAQDVETSSMGGFSDEGQSLVGFGEGARTPARQHSQIGSPIVGKATPVPSGLRESTMPGTPTAERDVRMMDGMTYDRDGVDTTGRTPEPADHSMERGDETTDRLMRERRERGPDDY